MAGQKAHKKTKLLEYLANPENEFLCRSKYAVEVLEYSQASNIYVTFTPQELGEIEKEALLIRATRMTWQASNVLMAVYKRALDGDMQAAKIFLERTLGKVPDVVYQTTKIEGIDIRLIPAKHSQDQGVIDQHSPIEITEKT